MFFKTNKQIGGEGCWRAEGKQLHTNLLLQPAPLSGTLGTSWSWGLISAPFPPLWPYDTQLGRAELAPLHLM